MQKNNVIICKTNFYAGHFWDIFGTILSYCGHSVLQNNREKPFIEERQWK